MTKVINFKEKRDKVVEEKRRSFERVVFDNMVGAYSVIDDDGSIYPIRLVDISKTGCLFQVPLSHADKKFGDGHELMLRMYFTKKSYIPVCVKIKYDYEHREDDGSEFLRYGCEFDTSIESFKALEKFIQFLYLYSDFSHIDKGDNKIFFL